MKSILTEQITSLEMCSSREHKDGESWSIQNVDSGRTPTERLTRLTKLTVDGTVDNDNFRVQPDPTNSLFVQVLVNGVLAKTLPGANVHRITINGLGGNDGLVVSTGIEVDSNIQIRQPPDGDGGQGEPPEAVQAAMDLLVGQIEFLGGDGTDELTIENAGDEYSLLFLVGPEEQAGVVGISGEERVTAIAFEGVETFDQQVPTASENLLPALRDGLEQFVDYSAEFSEGHAAWPGYRIVWRISRQGFERYDLG